ncbi:MAG TPA: type I phosphomannose isomerase catalytic subunit [Terriglobales bacterium]|nr:type I phosphomannose isomerase catalytic subunit [Terriglobales bacterium]
MPELYPLLLRPQFHQRVWGARSLAPIYSQEFSEPVGEAWLTGEQCQVANGPLTGRTLAELTRDYGAELIGATPDKSRFPLLIKFLFPQDKLSVQVHPDDAGAKSKGEACGKTECWYVWSAEPGAQIGLGLRPGTTKGVIERAIRETRMEELLNWIEVRAGDMFYVDAGTVHAIGPGSVLVETQQNSDTTYRLYDYGRPRELHIEDGLAAVKEETHAGRVLPERPEIEKGSQQSNLVTSPCFVVDKFRLAEQWEFQRDAGVSANVFCLVATEGCGEIEFGVMPPVTFCTGQAVVVPAAVKGFSIKPQRELEFLCSSVPAMKVEHPATVLVGTTAGSPL